MSFMTLVRNTLIAIFILSLPTANASNQPLELDVYQADGNSFYVSSVLVKGKTEAVLIDAQFTLSDAHEVVAKILRSGKRLTSVYVSHGDPDYYFGLQVIKQAFPTVKIYATEETVKHIKQTVKKKLAYWGPKLGTNGPTNTFIPEVLKQDTLLVDNVELKVVGLKQHSKRTFVWIPSIKAIAGGVPIYGDTHLWIADAATKEKRQEWLKILDKIDALNPDIVIPGHATVNSDKTLSSVQFTRSYLLAYEKALAKAANSQQLIKMINEAYPQAVLPIALEIGAKVSTGEMIW